jgi:hypothetical protein
MYDLVITTDAEADIQAAFEWWRDHRSAEQAIRWYTRFILQSKRCARCRRAALRPENTTSTQAI